MREHHRLGPIAVVVGSDARTLLVQNVGGQVYDIVLEMVYKLAAGVTLGSWYQISDFGFDVHVSTSNLDAHPLLIQALLLRDNLFVGVATGQLTELEPEQTRRITLLAGGPLPRYDEIMFVAEVVGG